MLAEYFPEGAGDIRCRKAVDGGVNLGLKRDEAGRGEKPLLQRRPVYRASRRIGEVVVVASAAVVMQVTGDEVRPKFIERVRDRCDAALEPRSLDPVAKGSGADALRHEVGMAGVIAEAQEWRFECAKDLEEAG